MERIVRSAKNTIRHAPRLAARIAKAEAKVRADTPKTFGNIA